MICAEPSSILKKMVNHQIVQDVTASESLGNNHIKDFCLEILKPVIPLRLFPHYIIGVTVVGCYFSKDISMDTHKFYVL
jgi:hypothetical protein